MHWHQEDRHWHTKDVILHCPFGCSFACYDGWSSKGQAVQGARNFDKDLHERQDASSYVEHQHSCRNLRGALMLPVPTSTSSSQKLVSIVCRWHGSNLYTEYGPNHVGFQAWRNHASSLHGSFHGRWCYANGQQPKGSSERHHACCNGQH